MTNSENEKLALELARAETEKEVIDILNRTGYWDDDSAWREYGTTSTNFSTISTQQGNADSALVEKLVNSVDAVLMRECLKDEVDPSSASAPQSIPEAQDKFFGIYGGKLSNIDKRQRTSLAENIYLVATGSKTNPSLSVIDKGEGQSPKRMPETILSLTKDNKVKIPFVQGKFGMGGTGVLRFCSKGNSVYLIISKRNFDIDVKTDEKIYGGNDETRDSWGVTVVRREDPKPGERSSHYTYLAPKGEILAFNADELPLLPGPYPDALHAPLKFGTFIKLYEYDIGPGLLSIIRLKLYYRLALLLPDVALPIRISERRRGYEDHKTYDTTLSGLSVRLDEDRADDLEPEFATPGTGEMTIKGEKLSYSIYVFKKDKSKNYTNGAKGDGIIFSVNGQTHGSISKDFFARKAVGKSYLSKDILVIVDCSKISNRSQEVLFMASRDRLVKGDLYYSIEGELEYILKNHEGLKELENRRRQEAIAGKLKDSKPMTDVLKDIFNKSPTLASIFQHGVRIRNPFKMEGVDSQEKFVGEPFPNFFKPEKEHTADNPKSCPINQERFYIKYETDAVNDYFKRDKDPGTLTITLNGYELKDFSENLWNGRANIAINMPKDAKVGDNFCFKTKVDDVDRAEPFINEFHILIAEGYKPDSSGGGKRNEPPGTEKGNKRKRESRLALPNTFDIEQGDWDNDEYKDFNFDQYSALKIRGTGDENGYDFYINVDNVHLKTEMKGTKTDPKILTARYRYGLVLLGMSILNFEKNRQENQTEGEDNASDETELPMDNDQIARLTEAISPILLPMIAHLGSSELDD